MRDGNLEAEKGANIAEVDLIQTRTQKSGLKRDPSFSYWCDEDGNFHSQCQLEDPDIRHQNDNFELPLLHQSEPMNRFLEKGRTEHIIVGKESMHSSGGKDPNKGSLSSHECKSEEYVPFDIENGSSGGKSFLNISVDGSESASNYETFSESAKSSFSIANVVQTMILILMWYTFSTFLTLYNKTLLGDNLGKFPAPLLMTAIHFAMQAVFSRIIVWFWLSKSQPRTKMSWRDYFVRVVPTALGTALDVDLSNASLVFISVTFATMCKSAAPIFLLLFAFAFRLEYPSFKLLGIILIISVGVLLAVAKETEFDFWGFIFVLLAAVMSGFRWCMTQLLLQKESYGLKNPFMLMSYVAPVMTIVTAIFSLLLDPWDEFKKNNYFDSSWHVTRSCLLMLLGGILAFVMVLTEYILVSVTSAVTVTIAGVVKEAVTIVVAVFYFHDEFTWLKGLGLVTIMVGVSLFNWYKYLKLQQGKENKDDARESDTANAAAKYVILEEMDDQEDGS